MRRTTALLIALLLSLASSAHARIWYVSHNGTGGGVTVGDPCALGTANYSQVEGDVIHLAAGTYTTSIRPVTGGSADLGKVYYIGTFGVGGATTVPGIFFERPYVSVSGVTCSGSSLATVTFQAAHDSLDHCTIAGTIRATAAGDYFRVSSVTAVSDTFNTMYLGTVGSVTETDPLLQGGSITSSTFSVRNTESDWHGDGGAFCLGATDGLSFSDCTWNLVAGANSAHGLWKVYNTRNSVWNNCTLNFSSLRSMTGCDECNTSYLRDYTRNNRWNNCDFNFSGTHEMQFMLSASGTNSGTSRNNTFYGCSFRASAPMKGPLAWFYNGMRRDSLAYCTVVSPYAPAFGLTECDTGTVVHNTFLRLCPDTVGMGYSDYTQVLEVSGLDASTLLTFRDNICYSKPHRGVDSLLVNFGRPAGAFVSGTQISDNYWNSDYNLWYSTASRDSAVYVTYLGHSPDSAGTLCSSYGAECHGLYGDPLWVGGTPTLATALTFDPRLRAESPARGYGSSYSDMGAYAYEAVGDSFTVTYTAGTGGSISCSECLMDTSGNSYVRVAYDSCATTAPVEATPDAHYSFLSWDEGTSTAQRAIDCGVVRDTTYQCSFVIDSFTVTYSVAAHGSIAPAARAYQRVAYGGDALWVFALPDTGYHFVRWLPDSSACGARADTTITADTAFVAYMAINTYALYYYAGDNGTIYGDATQYVQYGGSGSAVVGRANTGYHFSAWDDGITDSTRTDTGIADDLAVTASFAINTYTLTYTAGTGGSIVGTSPQTVIHGTSGTTVTATPSDGYAFYSWSDSVKTASRQDLTITANLSVSAIFNSISTSDPGMSLSASNAYLSSRSKTVTIQSIGTTALDVYSVTLNHMSTRGTRAVVSCSASATTATIAAGGSLNVTLSTIVLYPPTQPLYELVVTSSAGTRRLYWTYNRCP